MKLLNLLIVILISYSMVIGQEKPVTAEKSDKPAPLEKIDEKVDKKLDPIYFAANFDEVLNKRKPLFRLRKGNVPEQIWKIKTNGIVTAQPITIDTKLLIGTSNGSYNYIDFKTGEVEKRAGSAGGMLVWCAIQNDNRVTGMTWVGTVTSFFKNWEHIGVTSYSAHKNQETRPLGALAWGAGCIVTRRDNFPVMIDSKEDKIVAQPNRTWSNGEATAPLINSGTAFWMATSKGELISFDPNLITIMSVIKLGKSYATALGSEGNFLYALTAAKELIAYDATASTLKWKIDVSGNGVNSIVCQGGFIYVNAGSFYVIDSVEGKVIFERKSMSFEGFMRTKPRVTDNRIFTCDSEGNMFIFNKKDFALIQAINFEEDVMVNFYYKDKVLYVPTIAGHLYAIDVSLY